MNRMTRAVKKALAEPSFHWRLSSHMNLGKIHALLYRDNEKKVQAEVHTSFTKMGQPRQGTERMYYFLDGDKRTFRTEEELMAAWKELQV